MSAKEHAPDLHDDSADEEAAAHVNAKAKPASTASTRKKVGALHAAEPEHEPEPALVAATLAAAEAPAVARADEIDEIMDRAGERVGQFLRSGERAGQLLRDGAEQVKQIRVREKAVAETPRDALLSEEPPAAVARAEAVMDQAGERVGQLLRFGGQQVHRTTALAREAIEDFVAEAESIRRGERSSPD